MVTVHVQLFARLREIVGQEALEVDLPEGADVAACFRDLVRRAPALAPLEGRILAAVNERYAPWQRDLADGDRVAFIPPVSGG